MPSVMAAPATDTFTRALFDSGSGYTLMSEMWIGSAASSSCGR